MDTLELMKARHSVRRYDNKPLSGEDASALADALDACNKESGLNLQLVTDEPEAFQANKPTYGSFQGCRNYIALVGPRGMDEEIGYYGERAVLAAQALGVNSCWVALTYKKGKTDVRVGPGEKLYMVIALGYGETQGVPHRSKPVTKLAPITPATPQWFERGMDAAMLAPTAINQQRFFIEQVGDRGARAKALIGPCSKTDLGIVKYHFELGAGRENFEWV